MNNRTQKVGRLLNLAKISIFAAALQATPLLAQDDASQQLNKDLSNPVAAVMSLPFQLNYDSDINAQDSGYKYRMNFQPVIPFDLGNGATLVTRTIIPIVSQKDLLPSLGSQSGLGDTLFSAFYTPAPKGGLTWGIGPALLLPTSTDKLLGARRWGIGPTGIVLKQTGPWTFGMLGNHIWDFAGSGTADINNTLLQPFVSYNTPNLWTFSVQSESTYNWNTKEAGVPINVAALKLVKIGKVPFSIGGGVGYWVKSETNGPEGVRLRLQATMVLPKK